MTQGFLFTDPAQPKHHGNQQSVAAFGRVAPTIRQAHEAILAAVKAAGPVGLTCKEYVRLREAADGRAYGMNHFSARFTELCQAGRIARNGQRRDGAAAWIITPQ